MDSNSPINNEPAFPWEPDEPKFSGNTYQPGLSKREWFAGLAMQGMMAQGSDFKWVDCVSAADALIAELSKKDG